MAMEVGAPGDDLDTTEKQVQAKLAILRGLRTADLQHTVLGQYEGYKDHVRQDHKGAARGTRAMAWKMEEEKSLLRRVVAVSPNAPAFLFFSFYTLLQTTRLTAQRPLLRRHRCRSTTRAGRRPRLFLWRARRCVVVSAALGRRGDE